VDAVKNFAWSTVATAPSPATTGTSLTVTAGEGARYPVVPFNASVFPAGTMPTPANAEIVRVTARTTDVLTITRTQEGSSARAIGVGDQIAAAITAKTLTDLDLGFANPMTTLGDIITAGGSGTPSRLAIGATNAVLTVVGGVPVWATAITLSTTTPTITLNKSASGQGASIYAQTAGLTRWLLLLGDSTAESGANAGSNLAIYAYTDAGAFLSVPFSITRADLTNPIGILAGGLNRGIQVGAPDSGGSGFRMLRVSN